MFTLPPPPNFRGLDADLPIKTYHRHLPHWRQEGATYFVTFRLGDSIPQEKLRDLKFLREEWELAHPEPRSEEDWSQFARSITKAAERYLDEGYGECQFREQRSCEDLRQRFERFQGERYFISCWAIMPNHCHALIRPAGAHDLEDLLGGMKAANSRAINKAIGAEGALWAQETHDRIVRDAEHLWRVVQYIGRNPKKAGLEHENSWRRWIHPDWEAAGWKFQDEH
jgi:putative transposase